MQIKILLMMMLLLDGSNISHGQHSSVTWSIHANRSNIYEYTVDFTASLRPGWHIYSQYLDEGGPIPTVITLNQSEDYIQLGRAAESGEVVKFYDSLYEMEITWYMKQVTFRQKVKMINPVESFHGVIEYMACNEHICIPQREEFTVSLPIPDTKN